MPPRLKCGSSVWWLLLGLALSLTSCHWWDTSSEQSQLRTTVTAIFATNTQIALLRTETAISVPSISATPTETPFPSPTIVTVTLPPAEPVLLPTPTITPFVPPTPPIWSQSANTPIPSGDIRLSYTNDVLTLQNISDRALDLAGVNFVSDTGQLDISRWDNGFLTASLEAFPAGGCLMAWLLDMEVQVKPETCVTRHAWVAVGSGQAFWRTTSGFEVRQFGEVIAACSSTSNTCSITLP